LVNQTRLQDVATRLGDLSCPYEAALALADAGELLEAYHRLRDLGAGVERPRLAERLRGAGVSIPRRTRAQAERDPLTPTERRVGELATAGASNVAIAQELVISVRTVETHLTHIYTKTGARDRMALAAWWRNQPASTTG